MADTAADRSLEDKLGALLQALAKNKAETGKDEWEGMPEFNQKDVTSYKSVIVHFATEEDMRKFAKLLKQNITETTRSIWYPEAEIGRIAGRLYVDENMEEEEE